MQDKPVRVKDKQALAQLKDKPIHKPRTQEGKALAGVQLKTFLSPIISISAAKKVLRSNCPSNAVIILSNVAHS